jgi:hypothetical protein
MKITEDIVKGVDNFSVSILDNGFTIDYSGYDSEDEWLNKKLVVLTVEELCDIIKQIQRIPLR